MVPIPEDDPNAAESRPESGFFSRVCVMSRAFHLLACPQLHRTET